MLASLIYAFIATIAFSILFHVPIRCILPAGMVGAIGWLCYLAAQNEGYSVTFSIFLAASMVAILCDVLTRVMKEAVTIFLLPGIIPLVPGSGIYYTMFYFIQGDMNLALSQGTQTIMTAGAIAVAIIVISTVIRVWVNIKRKMHTFLTDMKKRFLRP